MQESILFFLFLTCLLIVFNAWYTAYKVCGQTKQAFDEFDAQLRRRLELIAELLQEIGKHIKNNPMEKAFNDIVAKMEKASWVEVGDMATKEMNKILDNALAIAKKHPKIISAVKLDSIKREIAKVDKAIEEAKNAYLKNSDFLHNWMGKFPFNRFKKWHFDIDKQSEKMESKKVLKKEKNKSTNREIDDFVASFKKKKVVNKKAKKVLPIKKVEKKKVAKTSKVATKPKTKKAKK